jgi:hypothetical protein
VRLDARVETRLAADPDASDKAKRVRNGIFAGTVGR